MIDFVYTDRDDDEEPPPTLGVREPRRPIKPNLTGAAEADLLWAHEPLELTGACVNGLSA